MYLADGNMELCMLDDTAAAGLMPVERLVPVDTFAYRERSLGYNRVYRAMGAGSQADRVIRTWPNENAVPGRYCVDGDGTQWRIEVVQRLTDTDGLPCLDITLARLDSLYDVAD